MMIVQLDLLHFAHRLRSELLPSLARTVPVLAEFRTFDCRLFSYEPIQSVDIVPAVDRSSHNGPVLVRRAPAASSCVWSRTTRIVLS